MLELCRKAELFLLTSSFEPCYFQVAISERFQCPIRQSKDDSGSHAMKLQKSNKRRKFILLQVQTINPVENINWDHTEYVLRGRTSATDKKLYCWVNFEIQGGL